MKRFLIVSYLFLTFAYRLFAAPPQFATRQDIAVSNYQLLGGVVVADFNGDGRPDIATTDQFDHRIIVYLSDTTGGFSAPIYSDLQIGNDVEYLVTGDFNEDGKQDVIVSTHPGQQLDWFMAGNGDGTFTQVSSLPGSFGFLDAIALDINHDKHLDLICANNGAIYVYLGDGHGNFVNQNFPQIGMPTYRGLAAGDFNKDGNPDFFAASPDDASSIRYFLGQGNGNFSALAFLTDSNINAPASLATADLNGDGISDLVVGSPTLASVFFGRGDGTFTFIRNVLPPSPIQVGYIKSTPIALVDINQDAKPDLVLLNSDSRSLSVFLNDGSGTFSQTVPDFTTSIELGASILRTADINLDGLPDLIVGNPSTRKISIFYSIKPKAAVTAALTPNANPQLVGSSVTFTAKITGTGSNIPTGTVTLLEATNSLSQQTLDGNAQATFSLSNLSVGQHLLTISYSGDNNFLPATSSALTQSIADFQIALPTASQTVTAGGTATYSLTVTPAGGLTGSISITCSQLPSLASCDLVTVPVTGQPATTTLTVHTTAPVTSRSRSTIHIASLGLLAIAFTALLPLRRRRPVQLLVAVVALSLIGSSVGCSSGSTSSTSNPPVTTTPGTPQGTTQFTITSSVTLGGQTLTRTTPATLVVQ